MGEQKETKDEIEEFEDDDFDIKDLTRDFFSILTI
jgi:hypothetical protein